MFFFYFPQTSNPHRIFTQYLFMEWIKERMIERCRTKKGREGTQ